MGFGLSILIRKLTAIPHKVKKKNLFHSLMIYKIVLFFNNALMNINPILYSEHLRPKFRQIDNYCIDKTILEQRMTKKKKKKYY